MNRRLRQLLHLFLPDCCLICGRRLGEADRGLCLRCYVEVPRTYIHRAPTQSRGLNIIQEQIRDRLPLAMAGAWFFYSRRSHYSRLIVSGKYHGAFRICRTMGRLYGEELLADIPDLASRIDVLLPVGMHWRKEMRRGYNQAEHIALGLSDATGIPTGDNLAAFRGHKAQARLDPEARLKNLRGVYGVARAEEIAGLRVAVVDDVITTGSTATQTVAALYAAGAAEVSLFALGCAKKI